MHENSAVVCSHYERAAMLFLGAESVSPSLGGRFEHAIVAICTFCARLMASIRLVLMYCSTRPEMAADRPARIASGFAL
jgi:hypothetical protein